MIELRARPRCERSYKSARAAGLGDIAANVFARRVAQFDGDLTPLIRPTLRNLATPAALPDAAAASARIADAVERGEIIGIVTDYDVDGITAHALMRETLIERFDHPPASLRSFIGHRLKDGYGLSDNVADAILAEREPPAVVITADCGTSDGPRIARLAAAGVDVIVTDHHGVPDDGAPAAAFATVNPSRAGAAYPDPLIAGCMVSWLLMSLTRTRLIERGRLSAEAPKLGDMLDFVALGTVADAVSLFSVANRTVVMHGLKVMNLKRRPCWRVLVASLNRRDAAFDVDDLGFQIGPRINARGRMADPFAALNFLLADSADDARRYLGILEKDNLERRETEKNMVDVARERAATGLDDNDQVVVVYDEGFHPGVQGIVASRLLEKFGRVTAVLSPARDAGLITGSLRSVDDVDVGAALRDMARADPGLLHRFGGHPKAAGVTLRAADLARFRDALATAVRSQLGDRKLGPVLFHDGDLPAAAIGAATLRELGAIKPYGRGFEPPLYRGDFRVAKIRAVGADPIHLSLQLEADGTQCRAIWFRALPDADAPWPIDRGDRVTCVYRLSADDYRGGDAVQLIVEHARRGVG